MVQIRIKMLVFTGLLFLILPSFAFSLECKSGNGVDYRGTTTKTASGRTCQRWDSNIPHRVNYTPETSPYADLKENYCRNPDNDSTGPWCYTQDVKKRWEYCQIKNCEEECMFCSGENYRGKISQTEDGVTCQRWDSQTPHRHEYTSTTFPDKYFEENYCRNPDGEPRPWCFTTDTQKRWAFCNVPRCSAEPPDIEVETECYTGTGQKYRGDISTTISGKICQRWDAQFPHMHSRTPENYPCKGLEGNYCRNPENEKEPWCYTTNPNTRWEYCQVQKCSHLPPGPVNEGGSTDCFSGNGYNYRGTTSVTMSGKRCQEWDSMSPHRHEKTSQDFPNAGLFGNYCRNPDQDKAPWCFTTDPLVRWEYCRISKCGASPSQSPTIIPVHGRSSETLQVTDDQPDCQVGNGVTYRGTRSTTSSGRTCQHWSLMSPHFHIIFTPESHPDDGLEGNYCRNPDEDPNGPWCYTTDPQKRHDYCNDIPICEQQHNECGRPSVEPKRCFGSIVGGCISKPYSWPWQVSLRINFDTHFCGGSLIDTKWVVTAKHCLERSLNPLAYRVYLGIYRERGAEPSRQIILVDKIFLEPSGNDIALLKLKRPAVLTDKVALICLPTQDYILPNGAECYVSGWGETQGTGRDGVLKEAASSVIENNICNQPEHLDGSVKNSELCAGNIGHSVGNCQGDTGGPLVCPNSRNQYILQGVMSRGCAGRTKPGVYVRVSFFIDWIKITIRQG